jgi:hypothetical protein
MPTITIDLPDISGEAGPFSLWLRKRSDRALVNTGGDLLTEIEVATVKTGVWSATIAETIPAEDCHARVYEGTTETPANIIGGGILYNGQTEVGKEAAASSGALTTEQANQIALLPGIASAIAGGPVNAVGRVSTGGRLLVYIGDDWKAARGTSQRIPVSDPTGGLFAKLTALTVANLQAGASRAGFAPGLIPMTVVGFSQATVGGVLQCLIEVELTAAGVGLQASDDYQYQIQQRQGTDDFVEIEGPLFLRARRVAAS